MSGADRCDEVLRLIDEVLAEAERNASRRPAPRSTNRPEAR
jgi:hypothetical protein